MPTRNSNGLQSKLIDLIRRISEKVFDRKIKGVPREWVATVASASISPNAVGNVYLNGDTSSTPISVKNKSHETMNNGDECYLHSPVGSLNSCVILYKK